MNVRKQLVLIISPFAILFLLSACNKSNLSPTEIKETVRTSEATVTTPEPTETPIPLTPTPIPLAAMVNGEVITLAEYRAELTRFQASGMITGTEVASSTNTIVLNDLIDQTLLAQGAIEKGYSVDDSSLESKIMELENQIGGAQTLKNWQTANNYADEDFRIALKRSIEAAWMRDQIIAAVPETADEVHVFQILVPTSAEADQVYASLQSGKDFKEVASSYNALTGGDLGWFPRGYLSDRAIEQAAFELQVGQYSTVIKTDAGYHILYLDERDPNHILVPDARRALQVNAVQDWIDERRKQSEIQIMLP